MENTWGKYFRDKLLERQIFECTYFIFYLLEKFYFIYFFDLTNFYSFFFELGTSLPE